MSSLWTPGGEHEVLRDRPGQSAGGETPDQPEASTDAPATPEHDDGEGGTRRGDGEVDTASREEVEHLEREIAEAPAADVIANHCYGLFQLAAVHLGQRPPQLEEARLAIDALGAVVEGLGSRLGESSPTLVEGLAQIRLAFVQIAGSASAEPGAAGTTNHA